MTGGAGKVDGSVDELNHFSRVESPRPGWVGRGAAGVGRDRPGVQKGLQTPYECTEMRR